MARRKRGEGSCYQRKDRSWVAQYKGKYRYAKTEELARQELYAMLSGGEEESKPANITVAVVLEEYLNAARQNLKPRTLTVVSVNDTVGLFISDAAYYRM